MAKKKKDNRSGAAKSRTAAAAVDNSPRPTSGATPEDKPPTHVGHNALRETLESLAIAFILAFFIRTFVVEAFVIPTGSMAPALQGVHKDLRCPQCGERFRVNAAKQGQTPYELAPQECLGGMCPVCRYVVPFNKQVAAAFPASPELAVNVPNYGGDRIIVNKFLYSFNEPERWDVVVFKYPGEATQNYIKRLVGLPNETLRIFAGDLFVRPHGAETDEFEIARKPPRTVRAMRQVVHDTDRDPVSLHQAGWPLRWQQDAGDAAWEEATEEVGKNLRQRYTSTGDNADEIAWLRYFHTVPTGDVWSAIESAQPLRKPVPKLIGDFNSYNTRIARGNIPAPLEAARRGITNPFVVDVYSQGIHWVGDLLVEVDVEVQAAQGELVLELVEAGHRFRCRFDLAQGTAHLEILRQGDDAPIDQFAATAELPLITSGAHRLLFANVDDALYLWVDEYLVEFDGETTYVWEELFGDRADALPQTSAADPGDLAPVGVGSRGARVAIERLRVWRDIYYLAAKDSLQIARHEGIVSDFPTPPPRDILFNPTAWDLFAERQPVEFELQEDQFFVMGDNSPQSQDARLWHPQVSRSDGALSKPGGNYLERKLLIGRAISVVWPHTWHIVVPGFTDMRRIE